MTRRALLQRGDADLGLGAARGFLQGELEVVAKIRTAIDAVAPPTAARSGAAEDLAEDVAERVGEPAEPLGACASEATCAGRPEAG